MVKLADRVSNTRGFMKNPPKDEPTKPARYLHEANPCGTGSYSSRVCDRRQAHDRGIETLSQIYCLESERVLTMRNWRNRLQIVVAGRGTMWYHVGRSIAWRFRKVRLERRQWCRLSFRRRHDGRNWSWPSESFQLRRRESLDQEMCQYDMCPCLSGKHLLRQLLGGK